MPPICDLVRTLGGVADAEMWEVFNMGCGFAVVVPEAEVATTTALLATHHPGTRRIGTVTDHPGRIAVPGAGVVLAA